MLTRVGDALWRVRGGAHQVQERGVGDVEQAPTELKAAERQRGGGQAEKGRSGRAPIGREAMLICWHGASRAASSPGVGPARRSIHGPVVHAAELPAIRSRAAPPGGAVAVE